MNEARECRGTSEGVRSYRVGQPDGARKRSPPKLGGAGAPATEAELEVA